MEDPVAVRLDHLGVNVIARVAKLRDLLGQQLDAVDRVAEDDALIDLQLRRMQLSSDPPMVQLSVCPAGRVHGQHSAHCRNL